MRRTLVSAMLVTGLVLVPGAAGVSAAPPQFSPGAAGIGDPYFPSAGNGGYDVAHYGLAVTYDPETDVLTGRASIRARATQDLSRFNLDLMGLTVESVTVSGSAAAWTRDRQELVVSPRRGIRRDQTFLVEVRYSGVPETLGGELGESGFMHTDDGAVVLGEPDVAATWFPVNDHPLDPAAYTFEITVPEGLEAVANGRLLGQRSRGGQTTWTWDAREPMAPYLAMMVIGELDIRSYRIGRLAAWDAVDPDLYRQSTEPRTGTHYMGSQVASLSYKRLSRTISVPTEGAELSFWVSRDTEPNWDFFFVEAHTAGLDDWTTLPDLQGNTSQDTGFVCPFWLQLHPFLEHYQSPDESGNACVPSGTTGQWWAATGSSDGWEQWTVDLSAWADRQVEVSLTYASDDIIQADGVFVDDVETTTGEGSTSFEDDADPMDGWVVPGAPEGSEPNPNDWLRGTVEDFPPAAGEIIDAAFARQGEVLDFISGLAGPYPFATVGGVVDDHSGLGFALETQTRPVYSKFFFSDPFFAEFVVVHELAHQWYGDDVALAGWQHIWLNEGFATYVEWLWSEQQGSATAQDLFDFYYEVVFPDGDPFWTLPIGDPGPDSLFDFAVYARGAMTLHALRLAVGDDAFFEILHRWAVDNAGGNVTTADFVQLSEQVSGQDLDDLFDAWLFLPERPPLGLGAASVTAAGSRLHAALDGSGVAASAPVVARAQLQRAGLTGSR
jgi:hypothetical protein